MAVKNPDPLNSLVGRNIKLHRINLGLAQTELAKRIGITHHHLQQCETGAHRAGSELLHRIAAALKIPVSLLFAGDRNVGHNALRSSPIAMLAEPFAMRMLRAYCEIADLDLRRSLVDLAERFTAKLQPSSPTDSTTVHIRPRATSRL